MSPTATQVDGANYGNANTPVLAASDDDGAEIELTLGGKEPVQEVEILEGGYGFWRIRAIVS